MFLACLIQDQSAATQVKSVENKKGLLIRGLTVTADAAAHKTLSQGLHTSIHPKHKPPLNT